MKKIEDLTPEELQKLIKELDKQTVARLEYLFNNFAEEIAAMGLIKSYISSKEMKLLKNMERMSEAIDNRIYSLLDNIYAINTTSYETAWKIGEKLAETTTKLNLRDNQKMFESLRKEGMFAHRKEAMEAFKINEKSFKISTRVWKEGVKGQIEGALQIAQSKGQSAAELARELKKYLQEPDRLYRRITDPDTGELKLSKAARDYHPGQGVYRSSYKNALRLARTEINNAYRRAEWESYQANPCIIGYRIRLSNNHTLINPKTGKPEPFIDICDYAQGLYPKDFRWHGWHPQCRCIMTPVFASDEDIEKMEDAILAGESPDTIKPKQITTIPKKFIDWSQKHKKQISGWSSKPDYVLDNEKYAEKYFVYKDVFKTPKGFITEKRYESGGKVMVQELVNKKASDYKDIFNICEEFARMGKTAKILPNVHFKSEEYASLFAPLEGTIYYRKCPDFKVGNRYFEYETFQPPFKKRKISNMISHGAKQSPYIVIDNNKGASDRYINKVIIDRIKDKNFHFDIREIWVYEKGKIRLLYKRSGR